MSELSALTGGEGYGVCADDAGIAHLVERHLAKVEVASSSLVARSRKRSTWFSSTAFFHWWWKACCFRLGVVGGALAQPGALLSAPKSSTWKQALLFT